MASKQNIIIGVMFTILVVDNLWTLGSKFYSSQNEGKKNSNEIGHYSLSDSDDIKDLGLDDEPTLQVTVSETTPKTEPKKLEESGEEEPEEDYRDEEEEHFVDENAKSLSDYPEIPVEELKQKRPSEARTVRGKEENIFNELSIEVQASTPP